MSVTGWQIVFWSALLFPFVCFIVVLVFFRLRKLHSRQMKDQQQALDKKTHTQTEAKGKSADEKENGGRSHLGWSVTLGILGLGLLISGVIFSFTPSTVGSWGWNHFVLIVIGWVTLHAIVLLNAKNIGSSINVAKWVPMAFVVVMLVIFPLVGWVQSFENHGGSAHQPAMSVLTMPPYGNSHRIRPPVGSMSFTGENFVTHCGYTDGHEESFPCKSGPMVYVYVSDTSGKPNSVTY